MNFAKFFLLAVFVDIFLYFSGAWYASQAGVDNPFGVGAEFFTSIIPASGQPNASMYSQYQISGTESGSVQDSSIIGFLTVASRTFGQITAFIGTLFSILVAPAVILNAMNTTGFLHIPEAIIVAVGGFWIFGELMGIVQFLRGGQL